MFGNLERGDKGNQQLIKSPCSHFNAASARPPQYSPRGDPSPLRGEVVQPHLPSTQALPLTFW